MIPTFLERVAQNLLDKYGSNLSRIAVVFPNKRAALYMNEYLSRLARKPIWSPSYTTISSLFREQSTLIVADEIKLVCDLYKCFVSRTSQAATQPQEQDVPAQTYDKHERESLDQFYGWGQILLSDFDDIDKCMTNARDLFSSISSYHEFDGLSYLTEEQQQALKRFFSNFSDEHTTRLKKNYLDLWCHLGEIYSDYRKLLQSQGLAYEGMLYREVIEEGNIPSEYDHYVFVGFSQLNVVEQCLFQKLKDQNRAVFYWDFDISYVGTTAISRYLQLFPNELDNDDKTLYHHFTDHKDITFISSPGENLQSRYISQWLRQNDRIPSQRSTLDEGNGSRTAIVLCNESLLSSVIHSLPQEVQSVNVTCGYPLLNSHIATFLNQLFMLRIYGGNHHYRQVIQHPYAKLLQADDILVLKSYMSSPSQSNSLCGEDKKGASSPLTFLQHLADIVKRIAIQLTSHINLQISNIRSTTPLGSTENYQLFQQESLFQVYTMLNRLTVLVEKGDLVIDITTLQRLMQQLIRSCRLPFQGEPLQGIQVMGMLETRNLDFQHLIILSCNEGRMPPTRSQSSFIPPILRKAFSLNTIDSDVAISSYHFHRLLQRASDITILYNNSTEDGQTGEMSQFMLQMLVTWPHKIQRATLSPPLQISQRQPKEICKDNQAIDRLHIMAAQGIYPTSINRFLRCQLLFYYNDILGIKEPDPQDDMIDNRAFGNIFHRSAQLIYTHLLHPTPCTPPITITQVQIEAIEKKMEVIAKIVDKAIEEVLHTSSLTSLPLTEGLEGGGEQRLSPTREISGGLLLYKEIIIRYIRQLLAIDKRLAPFTILGLEKHVQGSIQLPHSTIKTVTLKGIIDRIDLITSPYGKDKSGASPLIRVVDYKTGAPPTVKIHDLEELFQQTPQKKSHPDYFLQTILYAMLAKQSLPSTNQLSIINCQLSNTPIAPALLFMQQTADHASRSEELDPVLSIDKEKISDIRIIEEEFQALLQKELTKMFDENEPFHPTDNIEQCQKCPYKHLCN